MLSNSQKRFSDNIFLVFFQQRIDHEAGYGMIVPFPGHYGRLSLPLLGNSDNSLRCADLDHRSLHPVPASPQGAEDREGKYQRGEHEETGGKEGGDTKDEAERGLLQDAPAPDNK